jgi:hypothetical protein
VFEWGEGGPSAELTGKIAHALGTWPTVVRCLTSRPAAELWDRHEVAFAPREQPWRLLGAGGRAVDARMFLIPISPAAGSSSSSSSSSSCPPVRAPRTRAIAEPAQPSAAEPLPRPVNIKIHTLNNNIHGHEV